jgi:SAM-dependent methyltransferase
MWEIINHAYDEIFGRNICRKGKCYSLHKDIYKSGHNYPYIPNDSKRIARDLDNAFRFITDKRNLNRFTNKRLPLRFLDAGCGIGNIVTLASIIGFTAHGIELNRAYLKIARRLTASLQHKPHFKQVDIITFDKYHTYDLIYYYVPICDIALQTAFEIHLIRNMKVGAFMFPTGSSKGACEVESEGYFERVEKEHFLFEKIKEVPKDWIPKAGYIKKEYKNYIGSFLGKNPYR